MSQTNAFFKFIPAPKPWAFYTNFAATIPCNRLTRYSMTFSLTYLIYSLPKFSTILYTKDQMTKPSIPIPISLFSTPMILPIFLNNLLTLELCISPSPPTGNTIEAEPNPQWRTAETPQQWADSFFQLKASGPEAARLILHLFPTFFAPEGPAPASVAKRTEANPERNYPNKSL